MKVFRDGRWLPTADCTDCLAKAQREAHNTFKRRRKLWRGY